MLALGNALPSGREAGHAPARRKNQRVEEDQQRRLTARRLSLGASPAKKKRSAVADLGRFAEPGAVDDRLLGRFGQLPDDALARAVAAEPHKRRPLIQIQRSNGVVQTAFRVLFGLARQGVGNSSSPTLFFEGRQQQLLQRRPLAEPLHHSFTDAEFSPLGIPMRTAFAMRTNQPRRSNDGNDASGIGITRGLGPSHPKCNACFGSNEAIGGAKIDRASGAPAGCLAEAAFPAETRTM